MVVCYLPEVGNGDDDDDDGMRGFEAGKSGFIYLSDGTMDCGRMNSRGFVFLRVLWVQVLKIVSGTIKNNALSLHLAF